MLVSSLEVSGLQVWLVIWLMQFERYEEVEGEGLSLKIDPGDQIKVVQLSPCHTRCHHLVG